MAEGEARRTLELGCSHRELHRSLVPALAGWEWRREGARIEAWRAGGARLAIEVAPETTRRVASLRLPVTRVVLRFAGLDDGEVAAFMERFRRAFQRGGG